MDLLRRAWELIGAFLDFVLGLAGIELAGAGHFWAQTALAALLLGAAALVVIGFFDRFVAGVQSLLPGSPQAKARRAAIHRLKRAGDYYGLGEHFARRGELVTAARWFVKAQDLRRAGQMLAQAGRHRQAADLLKQSGHPAESAEALLAGGFDAEAAEAFERAGDTLRAARAWTSAERPEKATAAYHRYFERSSDGLTTQRAVAQECYDLLMKSDAAVSPAQRRDLLAVVAARFMQTGAFAIAGEAFLAAGDHEGAARSFVAAGELPKAAEAFKGGGRDSAASRVAAEWHLHNDRLAEAAQAFLEAGEPLDAGDCFARIGHHADAAACYTKVGNYFQAGEQLELAGDPQGAVDAYEQIRPGTAGYDPSRYVLGRCYERLGEHRAAAAILEPLLRDQRATKATVDYFFALGCALQALGREAEALDAFYRVSRVDEAHGDVAARIAACHERVPPAERPDLTLYAAPEKEPAAAAAPADDEELEPVGAVLAGRYRVERELGRGGMGVVYEVTDLQLGRRVALKRLRRVADQQRFTREARAAARIVHPNIVSVFDYADGEQPFITMELVEGINLSRHLASAGALLPGQAIPLARQVCSALVALHDRGIVHRDIKPENILITDDGVAKLSDFGLARHLDDARITGTGIVLGTPFYIAPELVMGSDANHLSDIYSFGLVLHESLTGAAFYFHGDVLQRKMSEDPPPPSTANAAIGRDLDAVVMKALARAPGERFQSAREMLEALAGCG